MAALRYDINEVGEMHHNPAKNVLYVRAAIEEIAKRMGLTVEKAEELLSSAKKKMYAARLQRPTPYVDKTVYTSWNAMFVSAYLEASKVFGLDDARHFALRSLDRILAEAWQHDQGMLHVIAYSDPAAKTRKIAARPRRLRVSGIACLDAIRGNRSVELLQLRAQDRRCHDRKVFRQNLGWVLRYGSG